MATRNTYIFDGTDDGVLKMTKPTCYASSEDIASIVSGTVFAHDILEHVYGLFTTVEDELLATGAMPVVRTPDWDWGRDVHKVMADEISNLHMYLNGREPKKPTIRLNTDERELVQDILWNLHSTNANGDPFPLEHRRLMAHWTALGYRKAKQRYAAPLESNPYALSNAFYHLQDWFNSNKRAIYEGSRVIVIHTIATCTIKVKFTEYYITESGEDWTINTINY